MKNLLLENINIDWSELRIQKQSLISICMDKTSSECEVTRNEGEDVQGIIYLIDYLQDQAVESGIWTEKEVFGVIEDNVDVEEGNRLLNELMNENRADWHSNWNALIRCVKAANEKYSLLVEADGETGFTIHNIEDAMWADKPKVAFAEIVEFVKSQKAEMKLYEYSIPTSGMWSSVDHGEVRANSAEEAQSEAIKMVNDDIRRINDALDHSDNSSHISIEVDTALLEVKVVKS